MSVTISVSTFICRNAAVAAFAMLTMAVAPAASAQTSTSICVDQTLEVCVSAIKTQFNIDENEMSQSLASNDRRDVNGQLINKNRAVIFSAWRGSKYNLMVVDLRLSADNRVISAVIGVSGSPELAQTIDEYDRTDLLAGMSATFSPSCWRDSKAELYKWFENSIKPKIKFDPVSRDVSVSGAKEEHFSHSDGILFCDEKISYEKISGYDTDDISLENPHGAFSTATLLVESVGAHPASAGPVPPRSASAGDLNGTTAADDASARDVAKHGGIGIGYVPSPVGAIIMVVASGSKAAAAGLKPGETIEAVNGVSIKGLDQTAVTALIHSATPTLTLAVVGVGNVIIRQ